MVRQRRQKANIPSKVRFARKTGLAKGMLQSAINAGIHPAWFVVDEVYSREATLLAVAGAGGKTACLQPQMQWRQFRRLYCKNRGGSW